MAETKEGNFITFDNEGLYWKAWLPEDPKAVNIFVHGAFSHAGNGRFLAKALLELDIATYAFDQRGWGHWEGTEGHIDRRSDTINDLHEFVEFVTVQHPGLPKVLSGHSMGGLISLRYLEDRQNIFSCALICAPFLKVHTPVNPVLSFFSKFLTYITPKYSQGPDFEIDVLSHDNAVITEHYKDQDEGLRKTKATVRWFVEIQKLQQETIADLPLITLPLMMFQGGQDLLVDQDINLKAFDTIGSSDKNWDYYPNWYHEVWNEKGRKEPLGKAKEFVKKHLANIEPPEDPEPEDAEEDLGQTSIKG